MNISTKDLAILEKFEFQRSPVGVKYTFKRPEQLERLGESTTLCTMLKTAQEGDAFYADKHNFTCGDTLLGLSDDTPAHLAGDFMAALKIVESPRSGARFYPQIPAIGRGLINYVSFSPLNKLSFDPDVMIIFTNDTNQTQILLRALSWRTAQVWQSKFTNVMGCGWIFVYPYLSGEVNYGLFGLSHGMGRRKLFPKGLQWVSIPFLKLPSVLQALHEIPWVLPSFEPDGNEFFERTKRETNEELAKHIVK